MGNGVVPGLADELRARSGIRSGGAPGIVLETAALQAEATERWSDVLVGSHPSLPRTGARSM